MIVNNLKAKYKIILINEKKVFDKIQHLFLKTTTTTKLSKVGIERNFFDLKKVIYKKSLQLTSYIMLKGQLLYIRKMTYLFSALVIILYWRRVLVNAVQQENHIRKEDVYLRCTVNT